MNIVFITTLYPDNENQTLTEVPFALHYFVKNWVAQGHNVQVIKVEAIYPKFIPKYSKRNKERYERDVVIDGVPIHILQVKKNLNRKFSEKYSRTTSQIAIDFLSKNKIVCDIVIFHVFNPSFYIAKNVKDYYAVPMVYGIHQTDLNWISNPHNEKILLKFKDTIDAFAFRSRALQDKFKNHLNYNINSFLIPSGIADSIISDCFQKKKVDKIFNFITVANMIKRKNIDLVIKAFNKLVQIDKNIRLIIIGDGIEKNNLEELALELNLDNNVLFLGQLTRDEVFMELSKNDVFILPSINETFGIVYLEAMAKKCIPIGTINEGIDGIILDGVNGYLCSANVESCFQKMQKILELSYEEKCRIYSQISKTILEYTEEKCSLKYIEYLTKIITEN